MEGMVINKIKKIAELILLKDKEYNESEKLKECLKRYINLNNEIGILEDTLNDLDNNTNTSSVVNTKFLNDELEKYLSTLDGLKCQLDEINNNMNLANYEELNEYIKKLRNIVIANVDDSLKWDIYNRISELRKELESIEWELELMILNYGLQKFEIDEKICNNNEDLFEYICNRIIEYLENEDENEMKN